MVSPQLLLTTRGIEPWRFVGGPHARVRSSGPLRLILWNSVSADEAAGIRPRRKAAARSDRNSNEGLRDLRHDFEELISGFMKDIVSS